MLQAFDAHTPDGPLIIIDVDCPALSLALLIESAKIPRESSPIVFLPAEDGGYVLVGARSVGPSLFHEIPRSTEPWKSPELDCLRMGISHANLLSCWTSTRLKTIIAVAGIDMNFSYFESAGRKTPTAI